MKSLTSKHPVKVEDLGVTIYPGQTTWIDDKDFESSQCLRALCSMGKVEVVNKGRHKSMKPSINSRANRAARKFKTDQVPLESRKSVPEVRETSTDMIKLAESTAKAAAEEATKVAISAMMPIINELKERALRSSPSEEFDPMIKEAILKAVGEVKATSFRNPDTNGRRVSNPEEPLFIPKGIVKEDSEVLSVNSSSSEDEELDSAVAALKALKKK